MARSYLPSIFRRDRDPFASLFHEVERVFDDFSGHSMMPRFGMGEMTTRMDVSESADAIDVKAELPGVEEKDIDIKVADRMLTIAGEKKIERNEKDKNWHVVERGYGSFARTIPLPFDPDPNQVDASFENGVLNIHIPKPADMAKREKKIAIRSGPSRTH